MYSPAGGDGRIIVFALTSVLFFESVFVCTKVTLPLCVPDVIDQLLFVTYDTTSSGGWWNGAKVSVLFTFPFSFSQAVVWQTL